MYPLEKLKCALENGHRTKVQVRHNEHNLPLKRDQSVSPRKEAASIARQGEGRAWWVSLLTTLAQLEKGTVQT